MLKASLVFLAALGLAACGGSPDPASVKADSIIRGVNYVGVSVSDLEQSAAFYGRPANLEIVDETVLSGNPALDILTGEADTRATSVLMRSANAQLRFMAFEDRSAAANKAALIGVEGPGIAHVCYQVAKKTKAYDRFLDAGAKTIGDPKMVQLSSRNPVEYAYARDKDGIIFEVEHVDVAKLDLPEPPKIDYRIRHVSLATSDMDRIVKFYSAFLGGQEARRAGNWFGLSGEALDKVSGYTDSKVEMAWFQVRNIELEIIQYLSHPPKAPKQFPRPVNALGYNMIMFDVSDLEAARKRLIDAGGTIVSKKTAMDGGQVIFGHDPDGNLLGLQEISDDSVFSSQNFKDNGT